MKSSQHHLHLDKTLLMRILFLVLLDQIIKLVFYHFCYNDNYPLFGDYIQLFPIINEFLSWPGNFFSIFRNFYFLIMLNIVSILFIKYLYCFYQFKAITDGKTVRNLYVMFQSGAIASFIDKALWGGSLDYIMVGEKFVFDLKDCYLTISVFLFIIIVIKNYRMLRNIKSSDFLRFVIQKDKCRSAFIFCMVISSSTDAIIASYLLYSIADIT